MSNLKSISLSTIRSAILTGLLALPHLGVIIQAGENVNIHDGDQKLLLRMADSAFRAKNYVKAVKYYDELLSKKLTLDGAQRFQFAKALELAGDKGRAIELLEKILEEDDRNSDVLLNLAQLTVAEKQFKKASDYYRRLCNIDNHDSRPLEALAEIHMWLKSYREAQESYQKLLVLHPDNSKYIEQLANAFFWDGAAGKAFSLYSRLLDDNMENNVFLRKYADCALSAHKCPEAVKYYSILLLKSPNDTHLLRGIIFALYLRGDRAEAKNRLANLLQKTPDDHELLRLAGDIEMEERDYSLAIKNYEAAITAGDNSNETSLRLARVFSWGRFYTSAIKQYDSLLAATDYDWKIWREKARVLGWAKMYVASISEYKAITAKYPNMKEVMLEMKAKRAYYASDDFSAIKYYRELLSIESENLEALFDVSQVYSRQSMWSDARNGYENVLRIYPNHFRAQEALSRVERIVHSYCIIPSYEFQRKKSPGRLTDIRLNKVKMNGQKWGTDNVKLKVSISHENYNFSSGEDVDADVLSIYGNFYSMPWSKASIEIGVRNLTSDAGAQLLYSTRLGFMQGAKLRGELYSSRNEHYDNRNNLIDGLYRIDNGIAVEYQPFRNTLLKTWGQMGILNDSNHRNELGAEAYLGITGAPKNISLGYFGEYYEFSDKDDEYFSPGNFWTQEVRLQWRHYLSKEELFWGALHSYYFLHVKYTWDKSGEPGTGFSAGLHHDFNEHTSVRLEASTQKSDVYREDSGKFMFTFNF